ncbi:MAG TPA: ATP-dependent helicase [Solirubrobacteraceae bacterium]|jgi:DNA helicase-2/ATP-dependent DNA helicase PcrA|nr:ATP-dependent helicase [Solirubrobacteraceae bacterium]
MTRLQEEFERLNDRQKEAVRHDDDTVVLAGPGSGKTATLAVKAAHLLVDRVAAPQGVACVTYSNDAVRELNGRLAAMGARRGRRLFSGTVHSFCRNRILRPFAHLRPALVPRDRRVIAARERRGLLRDALAGEGLAGQLDWFDSTLRRIRDARALGEPLDEFDDREVQVATRFEESLARERLMDFDAMVLDALKLVDAVPLVREIVAARFPWIAVDEYQDLGGPLHQIVRQLRTAGAKIFAVGDPDQTLYEFNGADPRYLQDLVDDSGFRCVRLRFNYRAGAQLIAASQATLALTEDRDYEPDPEREDEGVVESLSVPGGLGEQARTVAGRIIPSLHVDEGIAYHEIAALYPAEKHFCRLLLAALDDAQIPYVFERDARFPDQPVVRWLKRCAYRALEQRGPEVERFGSLLGPYREYVRDARLLDATLELELRARLSRALAAVEDPGFPLASWLECALRELDLRAVLERSGEYPEDLEALTKLDEIAAESAVALREFVDGVKARDRVVVTTYHGSKGRQFDAVVLMGLQDQLMPGHKWNPTNRAWELRASRLREQRRWFYVAVTRARRQVVLVSSPTWTNAWGYVQREGPSRFIGEIEDRLGLR